MRYKTDKVMYFKQFVMNDWTPYLIRIATYATYHEAVHVSIVVSSTCTVNSLELLVTIETFLRACRSENAHRRYHPDVMHRVRA